MRAPGPKQYRLATIVVSDRLLNQEEVSFYSCFARRAEERVMVWVKQGFGKEFSNPMWVESGGTAESRYSDCTGGGGRDCWRRGGERSIV